MQWAANYIKNAEIYCHLFFFLSFLTFIYTQICFVQALTLGHHKYLNYKDNIVWVKLYVVVSSISCYCKEFVNSFKVSRERIKHIFVINLSWRAESNLHSYLQTFRTRAVTNSRVFHHFQHAFNILWNHYNTIIWSSERVVAQIQSRIFLETTN